MDSHVLNVLALRTPARPILLRKCLGNDGCTRRAGSVRAPEVAAVQQGDSQRGEITGADAKTLNVCPLAFTGVVAFELYGGAHVALKWNRAERRRFHTWLCTQSIEDGIKPGSSRVLVIALPDEVRRAEHGVLRIKTKLDLRGVPERAGEEPGANQQQHGC